MSFSNDVPGYSVSPGTWSVSCHFIPVGEQAYFEDFTLCSRRCCQLDLVTCNRNRFVFCTHLCDHQVFLFLCTLRKNGTFQRAR